jgi:hypothetical protein
LIIAAHAPAPLAVLAVCPGLTRATVAVLISTLLTSVTAAGVAGRATPATGGRGGYAIRTAACALLAIDIVSFSTRDEWAQLHLRASMYDALGRTFATTRLPWTSSHREDRGDGILVVIPATVLARPLLCLLGHHLHQEIRRHNLTAGGPAQLRIRMAVHHGIVHFDAHGVAGRAVIHLFRLLDAPAFKGRCARGEAELALITSHDLYTKVIKTEAAKRAAGDVDATLYHPLFVTNRETRALAWIRLYKTPHPGRTEPIAQCH